MGKVRIRKGHVLPVVEGHPWIFARSIAEIEGEVVSGDEVDLIDPKGTFLGRGFYSADSSIRVRIFSYKKDLRADPEFFLERIERAARYRKEILGLPSPEQTDAFRLVHSEGDGLPGLVIDLYGDVAVCQISHVAMEKRKDSILKALGEVIGPQAVFQADDPEMRKLEGLDLGSGWIGGRIPSGPTEVHELGLRYRVQFEGAQKTGLFLDQRIHREAISNLGRGRDVVDAFCHHGGFALNLAQERYGTGSIIGLDSSGRAIESAREAADLNGLSDRVVFEKADVYRWLGAARREKRTYGLVLLDPPPYARSSRHVRAALQKYRELHRLALTILEPNGILVTSCCSRSVGEDVFERMLARSALDTGRSVRVFHRGSQSPDHPVSPGCPQGRYLKVFYLHVD
ncbi:MAG: class I SAM-dependent rRNA methyltransferase [Planctomycetota bacterium]|jgi:23S rRNA (cytosine1962-C5)-methyltransferase|nr:class I SAM-dependent rRNA methyltransferase [Planctomycetota bacterium]